MNENQVLLYFVAGTIIILVFTFSLILFLIYYKRKQQHHLTEKMNLEHQYQSQLLQSRLEVQEQAFKYLSEEIHDNVGQALSTVKLQLYSLNQDLSNTSQHSLIQTTTEVLSKAISDLRNISHNLNGGYVSRNGLYEAVEKEVNYIKGSRTINAFLTVVGNVYTMSAEKELLVFRIIQEAINNAVKHAKAETIEVTLNYMPDKLSVTVMDDGLGFDATDSLSQKGLGVNNMKNRATLLNSILSIQSAPQHGTAISFTINSDQND